MKQGLKTTMAVSIEGIEVGDIKHVEFIFKKYKSKTAEGLKRAVYPEDVNYDEHSGNFLIPWTASETYLFNDGSLFYLDTRIHLKDTTDMPETAIVALHMNPTLFGEEE